MDTCESLLKRFEERDRSALAQAITIIESAARHDRVAKNRILSQLLVSQKTDTIRVAISGPPGVGKSTLINTLGQKIVRAGFFLAVLPIDPSSEYSRGSILGDKTRMKDLLALDNAFIRPSPSQGILGGVSLNTPDTITLVEAFGCNFLLIETVGVGQSEAMAHSLCDHFVLILQPTSGDSLQLMKKGVLESADFILINKADEHKALAEKTKSSLRGFKNTNHQEPLPVGVISSLKDDGIDSFLAKLLERHQELKASGELLAKRKAQKDKLFNYVFLQELNRRIKSKPSIKMSLSRGIEAAKSHGLMPQIDALVDEILGKI